MVDRRRVHDEIKDLEEAGYIVQADFKRNIVKLLKFEFPTGWRPRYGNILFDLPDSYASARPTVYFSDGMSYKGDDWTQIHRPTSLDNYDRFCINKFAWNPNKHTLTTMMKVAVVGLNNPNNPNEAFREEGLI
jgi:hypothetical protein